MSTSLIQTALTLGDSFVESTSVDAIHGKLLESIVELTGSPRVELYQAGQTPERGKLVGVCSATAGLTFPDDQHDHFPVGLQDAPLLVSVVDSEIVVAGKIQYQGAQLAWVRLFFPAVSEISAYHDPLLVLLDKVAVAWGHLSFRENMRQQLENVRMIAMSELASAVAHQLNNPMTTIVADSEILLADMSTENPAYESLMAIQRASRRASELVHRLMAISHTNKSDDPSQVVDVWRTVEDVLLLLQGYIETDRVKLVNHRPAAKYWIWAPSRLLEDVWFNLLLNARDALQGQPGGTVGIDIQATDRPNWIEVAVWDTGPGIPPVDYENIFEPFYTTHSTLERIGLGLHLSKQIVESLGGTLKVTQQPGGGARFVVLLPVKRG